jgi:purine-binding chemotaxis protein CheW
MDEAAKSEVEQQVVVFEIAGESYGVDIGHVHEIIRPPEITVVPRSPEYVQGVINLRGRVIPVISLRLRFGMAETEINRASRIVVLEIGSNTIGIAVDAVSEVLRVPESAVEPPGATLAGAASQHLRGIAKLENRIVILLDLNHLLDSVGAHDSRAA